VKYIYLLKCGEDHYKIGIASSVERRVKELQTSNPNKIEVVSVKLIDKAEQLEQVVHRVLADYRLDGGKEWFKLTHEQVIGVLIRINQIPEAAGLVGAVEALQKINKRASDLSEISADLKAIRAYIEKQNSMKVIERKMNIDVVQRPKVVSPTFEEMVEKAMAIFIQDGRASTSLLQRRMSIGYARAARIVDHLVQTKRIGEPTSPTQGREIFDTAIINSSTEQGI
jgi:DNA segregation ATPase FtsK/SpoIIIE-like protein